MRRSETDLIVLKAVHHEPALECQTQGPTIYFDGSCPLCSAEIDHYASRLGGDQLQFVDVSEENAVLGTGLVSSDAMKRFHVRLVDGTLVSGASAFIAVWETLHGWRWAARLSKIPGATRALEAIYKLFLPVRPAFSKLAQSFGARAANPRASRK
ncbi:thiol-disulfide oxidoreductase DCC family protein [Falsihalocynthiibacter sp. BN13B15]|uniref:thiol-disulfide oxidoreductase DCC family protein n=1 Tax=Falsihalocynthiibacter sp. BN13B15 TaxID=3240871 RepID=UPI00350F66C8